MLCGYFTGLVSGRLESKSTEGGQLLCKQLFLDGQEVAPVDILKQWQETHANRHMQFKVGNYCDGSWESNIRLLTGTIKVDWIQLPVEQYLAALPTLKQGVIAGVLRQKDAAPWGITRAEKLQLSVFLTQ